MTSAIEKRIAEIFETKMVTRIRKEQSKAVVDKALALPWVQWLDEAVKNNIGGVIWFQFEHVNHVDVKTELESREDVQKRLSAEGVKAVVQVLQNRCLVILYKLGDNGIYRPENFMAIVQACIRPF